MVMNSLSLIARPEGQRSCQRHARDERRDGPAAFLSSSFQMRRFTSESGGSVVQAEGGGVVHRLAKGTGRAARLAKCKATESAPRGLYVLKPRRRESVR